MLRVLSFCMCLMMASVAWAEDYVVLASTGAHQAGAVFRSGDRISVPADGRVTFLGSDGAIWHAKGPCDCVLPELGADRRDLGAVSNLVTVALQAPGATRDPQLSKALQPSLWAFSVDSSGNRCVLPDRARLWRRTAEKDWVVDIASSGARAKGLLWPAGAHDLELPVAFLSDGVIAMKVDGSPRRFDVHVMPPDVDRSQWGEVLIWMAGNECDRQSQFLIDGLHSGELYSDAARIPWLSEL